LSSVAAQAAAALTLALEAAVVAVVPEVFVPAQACL
jgi:hypothetical protein